jgi:hypothetical protein
MSYFDFMRAGDRMVELVAPEWYVSGTNETPIIMHAMPDLLGKFGEAWKDEVGTFHVGIGRRGLMLATVEDMASVVLHEFVHVKMWEEIAAEDWSWECKSARHELIANKVVIEHFFKIRYTSYMYTNSRILYAEAQAKASINECPAEVTSDMPSIPLAVFPTKDSSFEGN